MAKITVANAEAEMNKHLFLFGELLGQIEKAGLSTPELVAVRSSANDLGEKMKALTQVLQSSDQSDRLLP